MNLITKLMPHQVDAVKKLKRLKVGALYMEQGTGKTRTALELLKIKFDSKKINKAIWLCPCSVKENLRRDIIKHTGNFPDEIIEICGIETLSTSFKWNKHLQEISEKNDVFLLIDESNLIKNPFALRTMHITRISQLCKYKFILNGTPITRSEQDLFAQWFLLDWRILGYSSFYSFSANHLEYDEYGKVRRCLNTDYLSEKIAPYSYQIKKIDCLELPRKSYVTHYYRLSDEQISLYWETKDGFLELIREDNEATIYRLFTALSLVISGRKIVSNPNDKIRHIPLYKNPEDNPRIQALMDVIYGISEKCIIFCKYHEEINDICNVINKNYGLGSAVPFEGNLNLKKRQESIDKFESDAQFLVASKQCAGYGLNLQFCHYVVYYNNDFDLATRLQSEDRVHRIGQDHNVTYIDICSSCKFEDMVVSCLQKKENLLERFKDEIKKRNEVSLNDIDQPANTDGARICKKIKNQQK